MSTLRIGTRGSPLALAQTAWVISQLKKAHPRLSIEQVVIKTTGDTPNYITIPKPADPDPDAIKGLFTKEIEEALLNQSIDAAVHSMKDLFSQLSPGLVIAAVPEREDPHDCLISRGLSLQNLPSGARVATSSLRRQSFLKHFRRDFQISPVRGNLDTRLKKFLSGEYDALVVALAGVKRLGLTQHVTETIGFDIMLPAPGQGALAIETLATHTQATQIFSGLNHLPSQISATAERSFLHALEGGCQVPIGTHAQLQGRTLSLQGAVVGDARVIRGELSGSPEEAEDLGIRLAEQLRLQGADEILKEYRSV